MVSWEQAIENDGLSVVDQEGLCCAIPKIRHRMTSACPAAGDSESEPELDEQTCIEDDVSCTGSVSSQEI